MGFFSRPARALFCQKCVSTLPTSFEIDMIIMSLVSKPTRSHLLYYYPSHIDKENGQRDLFYWFDPCHGACASDAVFYASKKRSIWRKKSRALLFRKPVITSDLWPLLTPSIWDIKLTKIVSTCLVLMKKGAAKWTAAECLSGWKGDLRGSEAMN